MIDNDIVNDQDAASVRRRDHVLQIRQRAPMRIDLVKIPPGIAMKLPARIEHDG